MHFLAASAVGPASALVVCNDIATLTANALRLQFSFRELIARFYPHFMNAKLRVPANPHFRVSLDLTAASPSAESADHRACPQLRSDFAASAPCCRALISVFLPRPVHFGPTCSASRRRTAVLNHTVHLNLPREGGSSAALRPRMRHPRRHSARKVFPLHALV